MLTGLLYVPAMLCDLVGKFSFKVQQLWLCHFQHLTNPTAIKIFVLLFTCKNIKVNDEILTFILHSAKWYYMVQEQALNLLVSPLKWWPFLQIYTQCRPLLLAIPRQFPGDVYDILHSNRKELWLQGWCIVHSISLWFYDSVQKGVIEMWWAGCLSWQCYFSYIE